MSWASCPHAQEEIRKQISASIPNVLHMDVQSVEFSEMLAGAPQEQERGARLKLEVVSDTFEGLKPLDRQRLVHVALKPQLDAGAIHALQELRTLTEAQWRERQALGFRAELAEQLRAVVPKVEHLEINDLSDGHTVQGFHDGSRRALDPHGLELQMLIVSASFEGMGTLARHQLVQEALGPHIVSGKIHALPALKTWTPAQWRAAGEKQRSAAGCGGL